MANRPGRAGWLFPSLHGYSPSQLPRDTVAALILTAIAVPGQLATARLMGLPPMVGLFAFAAGSLAFAAFGANRFASVAADSTIVHLGGALGQKVWVMLSASPEWRYLWRGERMPWYPALRLFRQRRAGEWQPVIEAIAAALGHGDRD